MHLIKQHALSRCQMRPAPVFVIQSRTMGDKTCFHGICQSKRQLLGHRYQERSDATNGAGLTTNGTRMLRTEQSIERRWPTFGAHRGRTSDRLGAPQALASLTFATGKLKVAKEDAGELRRTVRFVYSSWSICLLTIFPFKVGSNQETERLTYQPCQATRVWSSRF